MSLARECLNALAVVAWSGLYALGSLAFALTLGKML